ncbi:MAG: hypothetical protein JWO73_591 [Candidatus Taylorbacteria bacterium]|nr:hypothetical protein [Candidatus Taylorbacteria bacterium]
MPNILIIFALLLMIPGLIFIPMMLPGLPYLFVISLVYGVIDGFKHISFAQFCVLGAITVIGIIVDQLAGVLGARWGGARGKTFIYGFVGVIAGTIILPIFGSFLGLFVGVLAGELIRRRNNRLMHPTDEPTPVASSFKAATASVIGSATGMLFNFCLAVLFLALFSGFVFRLF